MTLMTLDQWINKSVGKYWDFDGAYGAQCADLWNFYAKEVAGGSDFFSYMGAKEIGEKRLTFGGVFDVLPASAMGKRGDGVIFGATGPYNGSGWGHVGVLTKDESPAGYIQMINQSPPPVQYPARIENCTTNGVIAYLRPKVLHQKIAVQSNTPKTAANQRVVVSVGARYRAEPRVNAKIVSEFAGGAVTTWKGYVRGDKVNGSNIWLVGAYTGKYSHVSGFTNTTTKGLPDLTPKATPLAANQRKVGAAGARQREKATTASKIIQTLEPDFVFTAKGYVRGQDVAGSNIWFVGKNSGQFVHASGVTDRSTKGLPDITPKAAPLQVNQFRVKTQGANQRVEPNVSASVSEKLQSGFVFSGRGYVKGQDVGGNNVWIVGKNSGEFIWSGNVEGSTKALKDLSNTVAPKPAPKPAETAPKPAEPARIFGADLDCITAVIPAAPENYAKGGMTKKRKRIVIHQFGTKGKDTEAGTIGWFATPRPENPTSAHVVISGKNITQMISFEDRAYHAGTIGNDDIGVETDPFQDAETIASARLFLSQYAEKYGYVPELVLHQDIPGNRTNCGDDINLDDYRNIPAAPKPAPAVQDDREALKAEIQASIDQLNALIKKI